MKVLSFPGTFFYKFVFPIALILFAGFIFIGTLQTDKYQAPFVAFLSVIILSFDYWLYGRIKKVSIDESNLMISNFVREVKVPMSHLERASGSLGINPEVVWLHFGEQTPIGKTILFVPAWRSFPGFNLHPIVGEISASIKFEKRKNAQVEQKFELPS